MTFSNLLNREAKTLNGAVHELGRIVLGSRSSEIPVETPKDVEAFEESDDESDDMKLVA